MAEAPAATTFQFELVSPEKILVSEGAKMVVVPGEEGDFGVLPEHAPLLSSLRPGVVTVTPASGEPRRIFVSGGFADVSPSLLSVLAEEAVDVAELSRPQLEERLGNLEDDLGFAGADAAKAELIRREIEVTKAKLLAVVAG